MNIVVAVRCYNEERHVERFLNGYNFADTIVISDGGSTDNSVELIRNHPMYKEGKVQLLHFEERETVNGQTWNPDAPHMNFVLDYAKSLNPRALIFDDMDCVPNIDLKKDARGIFEFCWEIGIAQVNAFRLYLWGDTGEFFPHMNRHFDPDYKSLWGWFPERVNIYADKGVRHGTLKGLTTNWGLNIPYCLLHKSWYPDTIDSKVDRYNALELPMHHPLRHPDEYGVPEPLPSWAVE